MDDWFAKNMPDAAKWFEELAADPVTGRPNVVPMGEPFNAPEPTPDGFLVPPGYWYSHLENAELNARKLTSYIDVPNELLMADGLIPDTRPPRPPTPWRWRMRSRISGWREQAARAAYRVIAGYWPRDGEDDW